MQTFIATFGAGWLLCSIIAVAAIRFEESQSKPPQRMKEGEFWFSMLFVALTGPIGVGGLLGHISTTLKSRNI